MNEIYNSVNQKTNGKYKSLRFPCITFDGGQAVIKVVCLPSDSGFVLANKPELLSVLTELCDIHTPISLEICESEVSPMALRKQIMLFSEKYTFVTSAMRTLFVSGEGAFSVKMTMPEVMYEVAKDEYIPALKEFLANNFVQEITLDIKTTEFTVTRERTNSVSEYELSDVTPIVGNETPQKAAAIASVTSQGYNVTVVGVLAMPTQFTSKAGRPYEKFLLYDGEDTISCRYVPFEAGTFTSKDYIGKLLAVSGNVEYEAEREEATISVRAISLCSANIKTVPNKPQPAAYTVISPQKCETLVQSSMFDGVQTLPASLDGDFVVLDFETTGLSLISDTPTELGAVKISGGKIVETFSTLIDPRKHIPEHVSEKTGITDDMVHGQPLFEDILPDFYRFTYGCGIVCHNITFDFPFLLRAGNRAGWAFGDRLTYDTMGIAPRAIHGLQRLSLAAITEELQIVNDTAHRALSDAEATAKVFIAMQKLIG